VPSPSEISDETNWQSSYYELAIYLGPPDSQERHAHRAPRAHTRPARRERLAAAAQLIWRLAGVEGCFGVNGWENGVPSATLGDSPRLALRRVIPQPVPFTLASLTRFGHLRGVVELPTKSRIVCGLLAFLDLDQFTFYLPLTALLRCDARVDGYPFETEDSLIWRRPIDDWLASVATTAFVQVPFRLAMIGLEASDYTERFAEVPADRYFGYLVPSSNGAVYYPTTHGSSPGLY